MVTYYVLYDTCSRMFVRSGNRTGWCSSMNYAKHFTSEWNANNYLRRNIDDPEGIVIKKIQRC